MVPDAYYGGMAGWSKQKRKMVETAFYAFLNKSIINSKDLGRVSLGESLYWGQRYAITQIFDALEADIHDIYILKSRQLRHFHPRSRANYLLRGHVPRPQGCDRL